MCLQAAETSLIIIVAVFFLFCFVFFLTDRDHLYDKQD